jgi:hypothetical protein
MLRADNCEKRRDVLVLSDISDCDVVNFFVVRHGLVTTADDASVIRVAPAESKMFFGILLDKAPFGVGAD